MVTNTTLNLPWEAHLPWGVHRARCNLVRAGVYARGYQVSARSSLRRTGVHSMPHTEVQRHRVRLTAHSR